MQGLIPDSVIEEIKQRADIVDVVSEYVTLKKAGRNFLGICPFHKEKTPSFTVSREKQMFYCFGCGEGGHVFTFLMKIGDMAFPEAARHLAGKMGIAIPERARTHKEKLEYGIREQIGRINEMAAAYFVKNLFSEAGVGAREYLKSRGISEEVVKEFRLGYAEDAWRALRNFFDRRKVPLAVAVQAGLIVSKKEGDGGSGEALYDRFRGRLIFPIEDAAGGVIAFGGRIIDKGEPKYLNSPETPVYHKGKNLYGLNRARKGIRARGYAILVEGYFDLISLRNVGMANVVATLGTALTKEQVDLLRRYTGHVVVLFDADEAGRKALERSLQLFLSGGIQAKAVVLPGKCDPDDYVRKFGREELENIIDHAPSMVDYYIENIVGNRDALEEKRDAARDALSFMSGLDNAIERNLFLKRVAEKLGIDQDVLKNEASRTLKRSPPPQSVNIDVKKGSEMDVVELSLILFMLEHPGSMAQVKDSQVMDCFSNNDFKNLGEAMIASLNAGGTSQPSPSFFLDRLPEGAVKERILKSLFEERADDEALRDRFLTDTIKKMKFKWYERKKKYLTIEIKKAQAIGNNDDCERLGREKERLLKEEKLLS